MISARVARVGTIFWFVLTILVLQVVTSGWSFSYQRANAQQGYYPDFFNVGEIPAFNVEFEYRWINYYHTLPGDPALKDDHRISFKSNARIDTPYFGSIIGNGTGYYKEIHDNDNCYEVGTYHLLVEGDALMRVEIDPSNSEVKVSIEGKNLHRVETDTGSCGTMTSIDDTSGEVMEGCSFSDVDLISGGSYKSDDYVDYTDDDERMEQGCLLTIKPLGEYIDVQIDHSEIHLKYVLDQTDVQTKPEAKVTVTLTSGGMPAKNKAVLIKVCTLPGTITTDGHIGHDSRGQGWEGSWDEECDQGRRPFGTLMAKNGMNGHLLVQRTDNNGKIELTYTPPKFGKYQYIAGNDKITATALFDPPSIQDSATVITKVPDLLQMPGSSDCKGPANGNYDFSPQSGSKHGCIFYGTTQTNLSLQRIADDFMQRQQDCKDSPGSASCQVNYSGSSYAVKITGPNKDVRINAMSLPWGGLTDNVGGIAWSPPHHSHNDGRQVDLSFGIFLKQGIAKGNALCKNLGQKCANYDIDRIMLLRDVIENSSNFYRFPSYEGGNLAATFNDKAPHIHIFFNN